MNHIFIFVYANISHRKSHSSNMDVLDRFFFNRGNINFARHVLSTMQQSLEDGLEQYLQRLKAFSQNFKFKATTAGKGKVQIYYRLLYKLYRIELYLSDMLENKQIDLAIACEQAFTLVMGEKQSSSYLQTSVAEIAVSTHTLTSPLVQASQIGKTKEQYSTADFSIFEPAPCHFKIFSPKDTVYTANLANRRKFYSFVVSS